MGILGEKITGAETTNTKEHHLTLLAIEIGSQSSQIEFGEEGTLKHCVDAMHSTELRLLHLMVQDSSIAGAFHDE